MFTDRCSVMRRVSKIVGFVAASMAVAALYAGCAAGAAGLDGSLTQPVIDETPVRGRAEVVEPKVEPLPTTSPPPRSVGPPSPEPDGESEAQDAEEVEEEVVMVVHGSLPHDFGVVSLEERIVWSNVVARVRLLSVSAAV